MCCMLVIPFRCTKGSLYSVFDIEDCSEVKFTYFIGYFKAVTILSRLHVDDVIEVGFYITLEGY